MVDSGAQQEAQPDIRADPFQKRLVTYCFNNLKHFLKTREILEHPSDFDTILSPLFVTWNKEGDLRGCIGTFAEDGKLGETLSQYSLIAAVKDTRFKPISESELPLLSCEISLLSNFEEI